MFIVKFPVALYKMWSFVIATITTDTSLEKNLLELEQGHMTYTSILLRLDQILNSRTDFL